MGATAPGFTQRFSVDKDVNAPS